MATIVDYLNKKATVLRMSGANAFIECPSCGTRKLKCSIHVNKAIGNCFRASCGLNGGFRFPRLITYLENVPYSEALSIATRYSDEVEKEYQSATFGTNHRYPKNSLPVQELINLSEYKKDKRLHYLALHGVEYLVKRGMGLKEIEEYQFGIGYEDYEVEGKEIIRNGMIMIPIFFNQEVVSYTSRSIEYHGSLLAKEKHVHATTEEGYLTTGQIFFNCDVAIPHARKVGYLTIVEDAWSAIKLNAIGTLGSNLSSEQIYILGSNWYGPVVICRDNDVGGRNAAEKDAEKLSKVYKDVRVVEPVGIDPDDNVEATKRKIECSKPINLFDFRLSHLLDK